MRLLIATDFFYPHWTGLAKSMYYFIQYFENKLSMTVLTTKHKKELSKAECFYQTHVIRASPLFWISRVYSISSIFIFASLIRKHDAVLLNSPCINIIPFAMLTKLFRKKLTIFHHGDLILPKGLLNRCIEKVFDLSSFFAFSLADRLSTHTDDYAKNSLKKSGITFVAVGLILSI